MDFGIHLCHIFVFRLDRPAGVVFFLLVRAWSLPAQPRQAPNPKPSTLNLPNLLGMLSPHSPLNVRRSTRSRKVVVTKAKQDVDAVLEAQEKKEKEEWRRSREAGE